MNIVFLVIDGLIEIPTINEIFKIIFNLPQQIISWLKSNEGKNNFYAWLIFTAFVGGLFSLSKKTVTFLYFELIKSKNYSKYFGEFYLYHPPLIENLNDLPRISKLVLNKNLIKNFYAAQYNIDHIEIAQEGTFKVHEAVISFELNDKKKDCPKSIIIWKFQKRNKTNDRATIGAMCSVNFKGEPYHTPIIVAESRIPKDKVNLIFEILLKKTSITTDIRRQIMATISESEVGDENEVFEHILTNPRPIGNTKILKNNFIGTFKSLFGISK